MNATPFVTPFLLCSEGSPAHVVPAHYAVEYRAWDGSHGDITTEYLYVCDDLDCLAAAQQHAEDFGIHSDTLPLTRELVEDATGWDLSDWVLGSVA